MADEIAGQRLPPGEAAPRPSGQTRVTLTPERVHKILCVCTGNSCRSVIAEGLFRERLKERLSGGRQIQVVSAGLGTWGGGKPTPETITAMRELEIDVSGHVSQPVTAELVRSADVILVMEASHREIMQQRFPEAGGKVFLLKEFQATRPVSDPSIADPIGQPLWVYTQCRMIIEDSVERIVRWLAGR